jgi:hypothetical protein
MPYLFTALRWWSPRIDVDLSNGRTSRPRWIALRPSESAGSAQEALKAEGLQ